MQLEEVEKVTEGWIMALYLQLLSFIESGRFEEGGMRNLIHKALWNQLPKQERKLLLAISIFPCFSLVQATVMSGMSAVQTERFLREKRVFIHFDREARRFYLHPLFQSFLSEQFTLLPEAKQKQSILLGISGGASRRSGEHHPLLLSLRRMGTPALPATDQL